jgi:hypothetical protein
VVVVVVLAYLMLIAGYLSKLPCTGAPYDQFGYSAHMDNATRLLCATDIQVLWTGRGVDVHKFPYVDGHRVDAGDGSSGWLEGGAIEYPVLTGLFMWASGLPADNSGEYLSWTAVSLLPVALLVGWQLATLVRWRALVWVAAPTSVFFLVYNWDLLPVAWMLGAVLGWRRGRYALAGACLGLGAATKIYPGFFLLPLVIERWLARDRRGAVVVAAAGAGAWLVANGPFMLANLEGWWATYAFQLDRTADLTTNSIYYWGFPEWTADQVDRFSSVAIGVSWVVALVLGAVWRPGPAGPLARAGRYPWLQVSAAMLFSFLAFNKVYSPQYFLWVLPLLALVAVRWGWWLSCWLIHAVLYVGLMRWYHDGSDLARQAASLGVWTKTALLLLLFFVVLRTPLALAPTDAGPTPADPGPAGPAPAGPDLADPEVVDPEVADPDVVDPVPTGPGPARQSVAA